ncbi:LamG domain-containing protein [Haloechinothrix halophila]|uniref:LamG domain-containing protein n=1 Tax=Haloechinothrix halophila TaxID=1069073 RepID=UPI00042415E4|nr:LamG domain-containing protein [Haloechinothrix halophila]
MATVRRSVLDLDWLRATLVMLLVLTLALVVMPALPTAKAAEAAVDEPTDPCAEFDFNEGAESDELATAVARRCNREVAVAEGRTEFSDAVMRPDGTGEFTAHVEPVRARDEQGDWAPIDTALRVRDDGAIEPGNTVVPVQVSGGGTGDFARVERDGKRFGLSWPGRLPEPSIDGDTATYAEVLPGVDLTVTAHAMGFSHNLVVKNRDAARSQALERVRFGVTTDGVAMRENAGGGVDVLAGDEPWLTSPVPRMWDSPKRNARMATTDDSGRPGAPSAGGAKEAEMAAEVSADGLTLVPDQDVLRGEDTEYPVVIDPVWTGYKRNGEWATVSEKYPNRSYWKTSHLYNKADFGGAGVGRVCDESYNFTCHTPSYRMRSFFRMNTAFVTRNDDRVLKAAKFKILQKHAWVCHDSSPLSKARVERTSIPKSSHTWNNQPSWYKESGRTLENANHGAACSGGPAQAIFRAWNIVKWAKDRKRYSSFFGMRALDESRVAHWKRYDASKAKLTLRYNTKPGTPKWLKNDGKHCKPHDSRPWITSRKVELSGRVYDAEGSVKGDFRLQHYDSDSGWTFLQKHVSGFATSGDRVEWTPGRTLSDGAYRWRMKSYDGDLSSSFTSWCHFRIDATPPRNLVIEEVGSEPLNVGDTLTLNVSATDKNGIKKFKYGYTDERLDHSVAATGNSATITWSDLPKGRHIIYVRAIDAAGNGGVEPDGQKHHTIRVGGEYPATANGAFRLDGDGIDDSGEGQNLAVPDAATWVADRNGMGNSAVEVDSQSRSCLETDSGLVNTSASFSVAAWVRPDSVENNGVVLSQTGTNRGSFVLRHDQGTNRWVAYVSESDNDSSYWAVVRTSSDVTAGEWAHLTATFDMPASLFRIYVDGSLAAEGELPWAMWDANGPLVVGCEGRTSDDLRWNRFDGAIDHVGVWQGLLKPEEITRAATELPAGTTGYWSLDGSGDDTSTFNRALTVPDSTGWTDDEYGRLNKAIELDGQAGSCLESSSSIVRTGRSFSVAGWAKLNSGSGNAVVVAQAGGDQPGLVLRYSESLDTWLMFVMADKGNGEHVLLATQADIPAVKNEWTHLAAVIDATDQVGRIYVNGELSGTQSFAYPLWEDPAAGPLLVGCEGRTSDGGRWNHFPGKLSKIAVYRGALTGAQVARLVSNPGVKHLARWPLQGPDYWGDGDPELFDDTVSDNHLSEPATYSWVDRYADADAALQLPSTAGACSETTGPLVRTDESFTVMAWVNLDEKSGSQVVMSQAAVHQQGFVLRYDSGLDRWSFDMPLTDAEPAESASATSTSTPAVGEWTHLTGVFDLEHGEVRLYVDGELEGTAEGPPSPWHIDGRFLAGCVGQTDGTRGAGLGGVVDDPQVWKSTVHDDRILDVASTGSA